MDPLTSRCNNAEHAGAIRNHRWQRERSIQDVKTHKASLTERSPWCECAYMCCYRTRWNDPKTRSCR
jgi:hypothetical protein